MSKKPLTDSEKAIAAFDAAETTPAAIVPPPPADLDENGEPIEEEEIDTGTEPKLGKDGKPLKEGEEEGDDGEDGEDTPESVAAAEKKEADRLAALEKGKGKQPAADDKGKGKPQPAKEDTAEADKLQLKGAARERFVSMAGTIRDQGVLIDTFKKPFGELIDFTKPPAEIAKTVDYISRAAQDQIAWDAHMDRIGLQPEQFGRLMGYGAAINSTDPEVIKNAREVLIKELGFMDAKLGIKSEYHDPLAEHPDLQKKVKEGKIDEEDALETARLRNRTKERETRERQQQEQQQNATANQTAINKGLADLRNVGAEFTKRDGKATFDAKMAMIKGALEEAVADAPPSRWPAIAKKLYEGVVLPAPQRRPIPGGKAPNRQQHETQGQSQVKQPNNALDAFDVGVEEAKAAGY